MIDETYEISDESQKKGFVMTVGLIQSLLLTRQDDRFFDK
jgi:hypothetical protein